MTRVRRVAAPITAIWLLIQTSTLVAVPLAFYAGPQNAPIECTCAHDGNHRDCPMHHASPIGARVCFQSTDSPGFAVLGSMFGHLGVIPGPLDTLDLTPPPLARLQDAPWHRHTLAPPTPPPPRA
jgi:hypothetical protein